MKQALFASSIDQGGGKRRAAGCDARPAPSKTSQPYRSTNGRYYDFGSGFIM